METNIKNKVMKKLLVLSLLLSALTAQADIQVQSPSGTLSLTIGVDAGKPFYRVAKGTHDVISPSLLGIKYAGEAYYDFDGLTDGGLQEIDETYTLSHGKRSIYANRCRQQTVTFANSQNQRQLTMTFRVYDDAVAFRSSSVIMLYFSFRFISSPLPSIGSCCTLVPPGQ